MQIYCENFKKDTECTHPKKAKKQNQNALNV